MRAAHSIGGRTAGGGWGAGARRVRRQRTGGARCEAAPGSQGRTTSANGAPDAGLSISKLNGETNGASYDWFETRRNGTWKTAASTSTATADDESTDGQQPQRREWYGVEPLWQSSERLLMARADVTRSLLSPAWRMMLLSDGSVTRHLQLLTDMKTEADCFEMCNIGDGDTNPPLPPVAAAVPGPRLRRQVWLRDQLGTPLVYACSWWNAETVETYLKDSSLPIWISLQKQGVDVNRQIEDLYFGHSPELEAEFGCAGPFWARSYTFLNAGSPICVIYEVFSPAIESYLGPNVSREL